MDYATAIGRENIYPCMIACLGSSLFQLMVINSHVGSPDKRAYKGLSGIFYHRLYLDATQVFLHSKPLEFVQLIGSDNV